MNINRRLLLIFWGREAKEGLEQRAVRYLAMGTKSLLVVSASRIFVFSPLFALHHSCGGTSICLVKTKAGGQQTMVGGGRRKMTMPDAVNGYLKVIGASRPSIVGEETILTQKKSSQPTGD